MMRESCIYMYVYVCVYMSKKMIRFQDLTPDYISRSSLRFFSFLNDSLYFQLQVWIERNNKLCMWKTVIQSAVGEQVYKMGSSSVHCPMPFPFPNVVNVLQKLLESYSIQKLLESHSLSGRENCKQRVSVPIMPLFSRYVVSTFFARSLIDPHQNFDSFSFSFQ